MARATCIQVQCDRCREIELKPAPPPNAPEKTEPVFKATLFGEELLYDDICERCEKTLKNLFKQMKEWTRDRKDSLVGVTPGPVVAANQAAPLSVPPVLSPPKPHSGGTGGKPT